MVSSCKISDKDVFAIREAEKASRKVALYEQSLANPSAAPVSQPKRVVVFGDLRS